MPPAGRTLRVPDPAHAKLRRGGRRGRLRKGRNTRSGGPWNAVCPGTPGLPGQSPATAGSARPAAARDVSRVRTARDVIGPQAELYVDANGAYTRKQAVRVGNVLAEQGVGWFEEPVSSDDLCGLAQVRDALVCDVVAGEHGYDLPYFARMIRSVDCLQVDATRCGGLTEWLRAAALAQAHGLEVSAHCAPHAHAAVAACVPNLRHVEWYHDHVRIESMFFDGALDPTGGTIRPDGGVGHGLELRTDEVEEFRVL